MCLHTYLPIYPPIYLPIYISMSLPTYLATQLPTNLSVQPIKSIQYLCVCYISHINKLRSHSSVYDI